MAATQEDNYVDSNSRHGLAGSLSQDSPSITQTKKIDE
jgi:hypothetical protein